MIRREFVLEDPHEADVMAAGGFYVPARIYSVHIGEDEYLKHRARIDLSPMTKIRTVQISIVQFLAYFDQFPHRFILRDLYSDFKRKYYLTSVSHCVIIYLLSGVFLAIILYHKSSVQATLFGVAWTFFEGVIATAPWAHFNIENVGGCRMAWASQRSRRAINYSGAA